MQLIKKMISIDEFKKLKGCENRVYMFDKENECFYEVDADIFARLIDEPCISIKGDDKA